MAAVGVEDCAAVNGKGSCLCGFLWPVVYGSGIPRHESPSQ